LVRRVRQTGAGELLGARDKISWITGQFQQSQRVVHTGNAAVRDVREYHVTGLDLVAKMQCCGR
jgi:hypothetical protein